LAAGAHQERPDEIHTNRGARRQRRQSASSHSSPLDRPSSPLRPQSDIRHSRQRDQSGPPNSKTRFSLVNGHRRAATDASNHTAARRHIRIRKAQEEEIQIADRAISAVLFPLSPTAKLPPSIKEHAWAFWTAKKD